MVASLRSVGYQGALCIENILLPDAAWLTSDYLDPVAETVALRDLLRNQVCPGAGGEFASGVPVPQGRLDNGVDVDHD